MFLDTEKYLFFEWDIWRILIVTCLCGLIRWKIINRKKRKTTNTKRIIFIIIYLLVICAFLVVTFPILTKQINEEERNMLVSMNVVEILEIIIYSVLVADVIINTIIGFFKEEDVFIDNNDFI